LDLLVSVVAREAGLIDDHRASERLTKSSKGEMKWVEKW
jgi:hypothetical protein